MTVQIIEAELDGELQHVTLAATVERRIETVDFWIRHKNAIVQKAGEDMLLFLATKLCLSPLESLSQIVRRELTVDDWNELRRQAQVQTDAWWGIAEQPPDDVEDARFIYVISCADQGVAKIGIANSPEKRVRQLSTASPFPLTLEYARRTPRARDVEQATHTTLAAVRQNGEWFSIPAGEAIEAVEQSIKALA